jgi:Family of unknown function (DUF5829)
MKPWVTCFQRSVIKSAAVLLSLNLCCATVGAAESLPTLFLSHFYVALDQPTYEAIRDSAEIKALAATEERHTVSGNREWTGFYIYGRQMYVEFFGPSALLADLRVGDGAFELVDEAGEIAKVEARLRSEFGDAIEPGSFSRQTANGSVPWFKYAGFRSQGPELFGFWVAESESDYLAAVHPGAIIKKPRSREENLWWSFRADRPLDDVVGLTAALDPEDVSRLARQLPVVGWPVSMRSSGFIARGPQVKVIAIPSSARAAGIQSVELRLHRSVPRKTTQLGTVQLVTGGNSAWLRFWTSPNGIPTDRR